MPARQCIKISVELINLLSWFWFVYKQSLFTRAYTLVNCAQRCSEHLVCYWCSRGGCTQELSWLMLSLRKKRKKNRITIFLIRIFASGLTENSVLLWKHAVLPLNWPCVMSLRAGISHRYLLQVGDSDPGQLFKAISALCFSPYNKGAGC